MLVSEEGDGMIRLEVGATSLRKDLIVQSAVDMAVIELHFKLYSLLNKCIEQPLHDRSRSSAELHLLPDADAVRFETSGDNLMGR